MTDLELQAYLEKMALENEQHRKSHLDDMDRHPNGTVLYWGSRIFAAICLGRMQAYQDVLETMKKGSA